MPGRNFLVIAREVVRGPTEYHWRSAAIHAYYALFLECRDILQSWGRTCPKGTNAHAFVRLQFTYAGDTDVK